MMFVNGGIADEIRLDSDENGFELIVESSEGTFRFNVHGLAGGALHEQLGNIVRELDEYWAEGRAAAAAHETERVLWPGEMGYAPDDPKSPGYHDRMVGDA